MAERMNNLSGKEWLQNSFTIWRDISKTSEERKLKHPAMFPEQLAERLIKIYTNQDDTILDPFLGVGSTLKAAYRLGRKGVGVDLNSEYVRISKKRTQKFQGNIFDGGPKQYHEPKIYRGDSRNLDKYVEPASIDLVITSPPYWDILNMKRTADSKSIRKYSDSKKDLGNISDYENFLQNLKIVYQKVYEALKPNKRCCSIVMDIRKKDKFYPLHEDQTKIMKEIGFELEEYAIWDRQKEYNNMKTLGYPYVFRFNRVHEFICIYWKR